MRTGWLRVSTAMILGVAMLPGCRGRFDTKPTPYIAELDLRSGMEEVESVGVLGVSINSGDGFSGLVIELRNRAKDKELKGLFLRLGDALHMQHAEELIGLIAPIKERGTPVHCYADGLSNANAALAAKVCSRLVLAPSGEVSTTGLVSQNLYFNKLLTEKLGLVLDVLQVGKFKGAEEPFTRDSPSEEARQSLESTLASIETEWLSWLGARPASVQHWKGAPYPANESKVKGLVDELGYADEALEDLKKLASTQKVENIRHASDDAGSIWIRELFRAEHSPDIVVLRANGSISMGEGSSRKNGILERSFTRQVNDLMQDDAVKAVVLRIDSPGGSALASDLMWHELRRLGAKKPLVVSVGGMAASGGYYLTSAGTRVYADATSIMGSIGVVGGKVVANDAIEKLGVHAETFTAAGSDPARRARAAMESPLIRWDAPTKERVLAEMNDIYDLFLRRVAEGRAIDKEQVRAHAEGRIFSGRDAKSFGLVDEVGGLSSAIDYAKTTVHLPEGATIGIYKSGGGLLERLGLGGADTKAPTAWGAAAAALGGGSALSSYLAAWELLSTEKVLLLAPSYIEVR